MEISAGRITPGSTVTVRGEQWCVSQADQFPHCALVTLDGAEAANAGLRVKLISPFDTLLPVVSKKPLRRRRDSALRMALNAIASARPALGIWTAAAAKADLLAYQLEPALAVLQGATRVLLADGVGLGKTIQAGLILCELQARGLVDRALIVTPAGLRDTWAAELRERFGLRPTVFDQNAIAAAVPGLPAGFNPWTAHAIVIASIDLVKRPEVLAAVEAAPFDVVIADEAHHLTPGSDRGAAIERIASRTPWVVLVSATPHSGDEVAFNYLTGLGELGDRMAVFRRTRRDVGLATSRRVHLLAVRPSPPEARMLRATESYARAIWHGRGEHERGVRLLAITLARRAASSATALERTLTRRLHLLSGRGDLAPSQPTLPWEDADDGDGDASSELLGIAGLDDGAGELRLLKELIASAQEARTQASKILRIARLIRRMREPAVIFTEYRDTLEALVEALGGARRLAAIHGGLPAALRHQIVSEFNQGALDLLVATDTAGEGLNLHHRCRLVIDVELPWNPVRLEQRIGRVDRIGQQRRVHAIHLLHRGTVEETVLAHLERRRLRAGLAMELEPEEWMSEEDIGSAALGQLELPRRAAPRLTSVVIGAAATEVTRLVRLRAMTGRPGAGQTHRAIWSMPRRRTGTDARLALLYTLRHVGAHGRLTEESCCALLARTACPPLTRRRWQALVNRLDHNPILRAAAEEEGSKRSAEIAAALEPLRINVRRRVQLIRDGLHRSHSPQQQSSLFDHRVERRALIRQQMLDRLDAALLLRAGSLIAAAPATAPLARLIAVWPFES